MSLYFNIFKKAVFSALLILFSLVAWTQHDYVMEERDGVKCFVHTVEKGHTLYSLSKLYQVDIESIKKNNPGIDENIALGQTLYIPVPNSFNEDKWTNPVRIDGAFMIHRIKKKETLYGISQQYDVDINDILEQNPGVDIGLKPGTELKIPTNDVDETISVKFEPKEKDGLQLHEVEKGETLYSISKRFGVAVEDIIKVNDGLTGGLRAGEQIYLPIKDDIFVIQTKPVEYSLHMKDTVFIKNAYNVALMLPFDLEAPINSDLSVRQRKLREIAIEYYRGTLMALDSLKTYGANFNVHVFDVGNDDERLKQILEGPKMRKMNLVVGPLQRKSLDIVSDFCTPRGIHMVCPVPQSNKVLLKNPNLSKVQPSSASLMKGLSRYVAQEYSGENVVLINSKDIKDARNVQLFKKEYLSATSQLSDSSMRAFSEIEASTKFVKGLYDKLSKVRRNIIVVPAGKQSQSMIANLQTQLLMINENDFDIIVIGLEEWLDFDFLDAEFKERFMLTCPMRSFIDYEAKNSLKFINDYRREYRSEPTEYAFLGYDVMTYYGNGLLQFGINFPNRFDKISTASLIHMGFDYNKTGLESGYENENVILVYHQDYRLKVIMNNE